MLVTVFLLINPFVLIYLAGIASCGKRSIVRTISTSWKQRKKQIY